LQLYEGLADQLTDIVVNAVGLISLLVLLCEKFLRLFISKHILNCLCNFVIGSMHPQTRGTHRSFYGGNNAHAPQI